MIRNKEEIKDKIIEELDNSTLNDNQKEFILYYLESYNATQSYIKAYPGIKNRVTARINAYRLLHTQEIKSLVKKLRKFLAVAYEVDPTQYLDFLLRAANADMGDYINFSEEEIPVLDKDGIPLTNLETGEPLTRKVNKMHLVDSKLVDTSLITSIKQGKDGITISLVDKAKCWEKIKDYFDWQQEVEKKNKFDNNIIEAIKTRAKELWNNEDENEDLSVVVKE